ncbi:prohibitin family protein [Nannocystis radixulma]|uniref:Prohibitin family protein n=1 Tax=Nannocystis radixulma TaxID=2995305 RepID=A0ABT5B1K4_9BACT|nr:prohibitin family protein [Nannocystis radixulma]MDC0667989.1 prohibitin family protein [Nannocystis radixulma]
MRATTVKRGLDEDVPPTWRERAAERLLGLQFYLYTALVLFLLVVTFVWPKIFISIPPGNRGVMYRSLGRGTVTSHVWPEGLHVIPPWDQLTLYEIRLQNQELAFDVLSKEGLTLNIEVSVRYQADVTMLGYLHQDVGPDYFERLIRPEIEAHVRRTFGGRPAHELYASARDMLQELSQVSLLGRKSPADETPDEREGRPYATIQELKLTRIQLPPLVEAAIAEKYRQEQLMLEYEFKLERESKEAERKRTEAAGIRDYNLIAGEVSQDLLRWRSIEATQALATADNSKVVVLGGGGSNGMQMLLNVDGEPAAAAAPTTGEPVAAPPPAATPAPAAKDSARPRAPARKPPPDETKAEPASEP